MSTDQLTAPAEAPPRPRLPRWLPWACFALASVLILVGPVIGRWSTAQQDAATSAHDAIVSSVQPMSVLWEQLALPVDERSVPTIESSSRLGSPGADVQVSTQLRVSEPNRIGVLTTVTSNGITTLLVTMVRDRPGDSSDAFQSGCEASGPSPAGDGQTCEQYIEQTFATWTVRN